MSWSTIFLDNGQRHLVTGEKGLQAYKLWKGLETGTKQQQDYVAHITNVSLPPSMRQLAPGYTSILPPQPKTQARPPVSSLDDMNTKSQLFHEGIEQGSYQGLPVNDR